MTTFCELLLIDIFDAEIPLILILPILVGLVTIPIAPEKLNVAFVFPIVALVLVEALLPIGIDKLADGMELALKLTLVDVSTPDVEI